MRHVIRSNAVTMALVLATWTVTAHAAPAGRPNVIVILADDLGYADVGFHGCKDIPTPHLDALARSGVRCTNGYASHPDCSPTRAGLLTGQYQHRFGHENNSTYLPDDDQVGLPVDQVTIADVMKSATKWPSTTTRSRPRRSGTIIAWRKCAAGRTEPCGRCVGSGRTIILVPVFRS